MICFKMLATISIYFLLVNGLACSKTFRTAVGNLNHTSTIYFNQEPDSEYYLFNGESNMLDCALKSTNASAALKYRVRWISENNNFDLRDHQIHSDVKSEMLLNGTLKLDSIADVNQINTGAEQFKAELIGVVKCVATDSFGSIASRPAKIFRIHSIDVNGTSGGILKYFKQPVNTTLSDGDQLLLKCSPVLDINSPTKYRIKHKWYRDGRLIAYNSNTILHKDGTLEIKSTNPGDSGIYKCVARYRSFSFESRKAFVNVTNRLSTPVTLLTKNESSLRPRAPKFVAWPEDVSIQEANEVTFECKVFNEPGPFHAYSYKWLKDGIALDITSRFQLVQGHNLRIEQIHETDTGTYTCRICSSNECDERSGFLKVLVAPYFLRRPTNQNATLKSDVELECSAYGVPAPTIKWFKNGEPIYPSDYFQFNPTKGNLKILGIISQDEGYYQCMASNELDTIQTISQLSVSNMDYSGEALDYPETDYAAVGFKNKANKLKKATADPQSKQTSTEPSVVHLSAPMQLRLIKARSNSLEFEWRPPSIIKTSAATSDKPGTLTYTVVWRAKQMERQREMNTSKHSLLIDDLTPETLYLIQVCAVLGSTRGPYAFLEVATSKEALIPSPPVDFKAEFVEFNYHSSQTPTLKFKWKKPLKNAQHIIKYRLYYKHLHYGPLTENGIKKVDEYSGEYFPMGGNDNDLFEGQEFGTSGDYSDEKVSENKYLDIDVPGEAFSGTEEADNNYEFLLEDLRKYSTYKFALIGVDAASPIHELNSTEYLEKNSAELIVETPSDVPDGPPEHIEVDTLNTTAIVIRWEMPAMEKRNGLIIGYKIAVKENDKQVWNSDEDSEPRHKLINNLLPMHKYSIRVTARTINGSGPASDWIIAETFAHEMDETKVPGQPLELFADPTDKSIVIQWVAPADSNTTLVRKYLLSYGVNLPTNFIEIPGNRNSFIIKNLEPSSTYILSLRAKNNAGLGKEILKDIVTKRVSALGENENLFPPLNVQAFTISPESIEIRWTDFHLKQEEVIPDDRYYSIRYNVNDMSNEKYKFRNATERNAIISDLKSNTLYDFAVQVVIGRRQSEWSMTTSQMTMETSPAPREIRIRSDPNLPTSVIINWISPNYSSISGYVISYLDVDNYANLKENTNIKWDHMYVTATEQQQHVEATVRKLKTDTVYYFKIQARNNRAYGASSPTIIFKTPNYKGERGGVIFTPDLVPDEEFNRSNKKTGISFYWLIALIAGCLGAGLIFILMLYLCSRSAGNKKDSQYKEATKLSKNYKGEQMDQNLTSYSHQKQSLMGNHNNGHNNDAMPQSSHMNQINYSINSSTTSTLLKHHQQRTPNHALTINNPNHMMMNMMPLNINSGNGLSSGVNVTNLSGNNFNNEVEFYSNMTNQQPIMSNNSEAGNYFADSAFQFNNSYSKQMYSGGNNQSSNLRTSSINDDNLSQKDELNKDLTSASEALAAANAAFNAPILNSNLNSASGNEPSFIRHTIRPKPIAIPMHTNTSTSPIPLNGNNGEQQNMFGNFNTRKSFKNLPMATATLISSSANGANVTVNPNTNYSSNHPLSFNFNDLSKQQSNNTQKIHYTARPYIIDNQVQSNCEYSNHSPASSCHSGGQSQVYDKLGNPMNQSSGVSTKSLLQPLKSFGANSHANQIVTASVPPSSYSIPNTPAKYCDSLNGNICNMSRSPAKKQLLVQLGQSSTTTSISRSNNFNQNNKSSDILMMMGKSIENIYDKKLSTNSNNEELTAEMANLEGIMKDLSAITAQQFEC